MALVAAVAAAVEDELEGRQPPMRDYGDERQRRETATRDGGDSGLATMTAAYGNFCVRQWQQMTMALINNGMQELVVDNDGERTRPQQETMDYGNKRHRQEKTKTADWQ